MTATIDSWGLIHQYQLTYTGQGNNQTVSGSRTIRVTKTGDTRVPKPVWIQNVTTNQSAIGQEDR